MHLKTMPFDCGGSINDIVQSGLKNRYVNAASNSIVTATILVAIIMIIVYIHARDKLSSKDYTSMTFYIGIFTIIIVGLNYYITKASNNLDQEKISSPSQLIKGNGNIHNPKYHFDVRPNLEPTSTDEVTQNNYHQGFADHSGAGYGDNLIMDDMSSIKIPFIKPPDELDAKSYISNIKRHEMPI
jgi:hypothetical protein